MLKEGIADATKRALQVSGWCTNRRHNGRRAIRNKCIASSNKCLTSSNKKLLGEPVWEKEVVIYGACRSLLSDGLQPASNGVPSSGGLQPHSFLLLLVRHLLLVAMHLFLIASCS